MSTSSLPDARPPIKQPRRIEPIFVTPLVTQTTRDPAEEILNVPPKPKKRIIPTPVPLPTASKPSSPHQTSDPIEEKLKETVCPEGCVSREKYERKKQELKQKLKEKCEKKVQKAVQEATMSPKPGVGSVGIGQDKYYKKVDRMKKTYTKFGEPDEDEDLLDFDNLTDDEEERQKRKKEKKKKKKKSPPSRPQSPSSSRPQSPKRSQSPKAKKRSPPKAKSACSQIKDAEGCRQNSSCYVTTVKGNTSCRSKPVKKAPSTSTASIPFASLKPIPVGADVSGLPFATAEEYATVNPYMPMPKLASTFSPV